MIQETYDGRIPIVEKHLYMNQQMKDNLDKVLSFSGLKVPQQISHRNVRINNTQYIHQIFTKNRQNLPHLAFLHGYGGSSVAAIRLFKPLSAYFQVHALDTYGIGFSSRGNFSNQFTPEQVLDYYVQAVEQWRKAVNIDKLYLLGHSFGGYISSCYAFKYPNRVIHLFLLSPVGNSPGLIKPGEEIGFGKKMLFCLASKLYGFNFSPSKPMNNFLIGSFVAKQVVINSIKAPQQQRSDWIKYLKNISKQQKSSQSGFYKLFKWPICPTQTISQMIMKKYRDFKIDFYFGDKDWMPRYSIEGLMEQKVQGIGYEIVVDSGHDIMLDNPTFICNDIIKKMNQ